MGRGGGYNNGSFKSKIKGIGDRGRVWDDSRRVWEGVVGVLNDRDDAGVMGGVSAVFSRWYRLGVGVSKRWDWVSDAVSRSEGYGAGAAQREEVSVWDVSVSVGMHATTAITIDSWSGSMIVTVVGVLHSAKDVVKLGILDRSAWGLSVSEDHSESAQRWVLVRMSGVRGAVCASHREAAFVGVNCDIVGEQVAVSGGVGVAGFLAVVERAVIEIVGGVVVSVLGPGVGGGRLR